MRSRIFYKEKQLFRKTKGFYFLLIFVLTIVLIFGVELFEQTWDQDTNAFTRNADPTFLKVFAVLLLLKLYIFITALRLKLEVVVSDKSISYKLPPKLKKQIIQKEELKSYELKKGKSVGRYSGSAFRCIFGVRRKAFVFKGDYAIHLHLTNGTGVLLGTQSPAMFAEALNRLKRKSKKE